MWIRWAHMLPVSGVKSHISSWPSSSFFYLAGKVRLGDNTPLSIERGKYRYMLNQGVSHTGSHLLTRSAEDCHRNRQAEIEHHTVQVLQRTKLHWASLSSVNSVTWQQGNNYQKADPSTFKHHGSRQTQDHKSTSITRGSEMISITSSHQLVRLEVVYAPGGKTLFLIMNEHIIPLAQTFFTPDSQHRK